MKSGHITQAIDKIGFANLSAEDLSVINAHTAVCSECRAAFRAARVSTVLLRAQTSENAFAPSAFFQAKVLNALREKQSASGALDAFRRWWQASATLIALMLMLVAGLAAASFLAPFSNYGETQAGMSDFNLYSTDAVIFNRKFNADLTTEQVFQVLDDTKTDSR